MSQGYTSGCRLQTHTLHSTGPRPLEKPSAWDPDQAPMFSSSKLMLQLQEILSPLALGKSDNVSHVAQAGLELLSSRSYKHVTLPVFPSSILGPSTVEARRPSSVSALLSAGSSAQHIGNTQQPHETHTPKQWYPAASDTA